MGNVSAVAKKAGILARIASQQVSRSRGFGAIWQAGRATAGQFGKVLGQLWLEVTGFVFLCLAAIGALAFVREYVRFQGGKATSGRVALAVCFTVMFGWFGVSSFMRIRKKR
jgi:hypothetical protein